MSGMPSARRYARAAFEIASERNALREWTSALSLVGASLAHEDLLALLNAPQVPNGVKMKGIDTVLGETDQLIRNMLYLLVERDQIRLLPEIIVEFGHAADEARGIARAQVTTAVPLDEQQSKLVQEKLGSVVGKDVVISRVVDPSILGGLVARVGDSMLDASTKTKLRDLHSKITHGPVEVTEAA